MRARGFGASVGLGGVNVSGPRLLFGGGGRKRHHRSSAGSGSLLGSSIAFPFVFAYWATRITLETMWITAVLAAQYLAVLPAVALERVVHRTRPLVSRAELMPWMLGGRMPQGRQTAGQL